MAGTGEQVYNNRQAGLRRKEGNMQGKNTPTSLNSKKHGKGVGQDMEEEGGGLKTLASFRQRQEEEQNMLLLHYCLLSLSQSLFGMSLYSLPLALYMKK